MKIQYCSDGNTPQIHLQIQHIKIQTNLCAEIHPKLHMEMQRTQGN